MGLKRFVKDYFSFTRKDRVGILAILFVILGVIFLPGWLTGKDTGLPPRSDTAWNNRYLASLSKADTMTETDPGYEKPAYYSFERSREREHQKSGILFEFDPNQLDAAGWARLGIREKTIHTILNYLSKGGQFRNPEDLRKIYGLFPDEFERIAPFVRIKGLVSREDRVGSQESGVGSPESGVGSPEPGVRSRESGVRERHYSIIDINSADTAAFISLPGIGNKLAARIVNFREKLGGFYAIEQVGETFGLADSVYQKIKPFLKLEKTEVRKININTATLDELKSHPYIRWAIANAIINYRDTHGNFKTPEELKLLVLITEDIYRKTIPYLRF